MTMLFNHHSSVACVAGTVLPTRHAVATSCHHIAYVLGYCAYIHLRIPWGPNHTHLIHDLSSPSATIYGDTP